MNSAANDVADGYIFQFGALHAILRYMRPPKLPAHEVIKEIEGSIGRLDRSVFDEALATCLACAPSRSAWRKKSKADPESWSRALVNLSKLRGYTEKKEITTFTPKMSEVAQELVRRFGESEARVLLKAAGAPASLLPALPIEAEVA